MASSAARWRARSDKSLSASACSVPLEMRLNSRLAEALHLYGLCHAARGRLPDCLTYHERAKELDPYSVRVSSGILRATFWAGRYGETIDEGHRILSLIANFSLANDFIGLAYSHEGDHQKAISTLEAALKPTRDNPTTLGHLGYVYARGKTRVRPKGSLPSWKRSAPEGTSPRACGPWSTPPLARMTRHSTG